MPGFMGSCDWGICTEKATQRSRASDHQYCDRHAEYYAARGLVFTEMESPPEVFWGPMLGGPDAP